MGCFFENLQKLFILYLGRIEAAMYLLKIRAPAAVYDDQGVSCLSIMVQRMPSVAFIALQQFYIEDLSHRKLYCYLNYLENKLTSEEEQNISLKFLGKYERHREKREMSLVAMVSPQEIKKGDLVKSVLEVNMVLGVKIKRSSSDRGSLRYKFGSKSPLFFLEWPRFGG